MDFYVVLGVDRGASIDDVKRAYRRLARRFHPDVNPGDDVAAVRFREIARAYEILSDPERRRRYDVVGYEHESSPSPSAGFEGFDFSATVHAVRQGTFGDLFAEVFRGDQSPQTPERGADLHVTLTLSFDEALAGGEPRVAVTRHESCARCAGTGQAPVTSTECVGCGGQGLVRTARGHMVFSRRCERCGGTGRLSSRACQPCGGLGLVTRSDAVAVPVPAGIADGARLRVAGRGNAGRFGGPPGDVYVTVRVEPHALFTREGDDLHLLVPVAVHEAALGARIPIPLPGGGTTRLRVPPGTQTGQRFRLRGRGAQARDGRSGDLVAEIRVTLPRVLDERSKELLRQFGEVNARENVREQFARYGA
jgi:molecular chaperone DnaJ